MGRGTNLLHSPEPSLVANPVTMKLRSARQTFTARKRSERSSIFPAQYCLETKILSGQTESLTWFARGNRIVAKRWDALMLVEKRQSTLKQVSLITESEVEANRKQLQLLDSVTQQALLPVYFKRHHEQALIVPQFKKRDNLFPGYRQQAGSAQDVIDVSGLIAVENASGAADGRWFYNPDLRQLIYFQEQKGMAVCWLSRS